jgi:hypothetical protein
MSAIQLSQQLVALWHVERVVVGCNEASGTAIDRAAA